MNDVISDWEVRMVCNDKIEQALAEAAQDRLAHQSQLGGIIRPFSRPETDLRHIFANSLISRVAGIARPCQLAARWHLG